MPIRSARRRNKFSRNTQDRIRTHTRMKHSIGWHHTHAGAISTGDACHEHTYAAGRGGARAETPHRPHSTRPRMKNTYAPDRTPRTRVQTLNSLAHARFLPLLLPLPCPLILNPLITSPPLISALTALYISHSSGHARHRKRRACRPGRDKSRDTQYHGCVLTGFPPILLLSSHHASFTPRTGCAQ